MQQRHRTAAPKAVQDCHQLLEWRIPLLDQFPRTRRFTLGERIETGLLYVLEQLVQVTNGHHRQQALSQIEQL